MSTKILGVCGSLRAGSSNELLLRAFPGITIFEGLAEIPAFSQTLDEAPEGAPPAVARWRAALGEADAIVFSTPEYIHGIPGALKNALDWLPSSGEISGKPIAVWSATASGGVFVHPQLIEVLTVIEGRVIEAACLQIRTARNAFDATGALVDAEIAARLGSSLACLVAAVSQAEELA